MPQAQARPSAASQPHVRKTPSSIGNKFSLALRYVRFQLLNQTIRWKQDHEETKVAAYHDRRLSLFAFLLHILPFAGVLALLILNFQRHYVGDVSSTTTTAIQFAAKLLEILIQSSLAAILLNLIRSQALGHASLPLGSFLAPYRMTDISYLWSLDFWGSATSRALRGWRGAAIVILVGCSVLLGALVGPASAVTMIPRLIDFPVSLDLVLGKEASLTFSNTMSLVRGQLMNHNDTQQSVYQIGNGGESLTIIDTVGSRSLSTVYLSVNESRHSDNTTSLVASTIPTQAVTRLLVDTATIEWNVAQVRALQPWVKSYCASYVPEDVRDDGQTFISFGNLNPEVNSLVAFSDLHAGADSGTSRSGLPFATLANPPYNTTLTWFALDGTEVNHSLLSVLAMWYQDSPSTKLEYYVSACVIDAFWYDTPVNYTRTGDLVSTDLSTINTFPETDNRIVIEPEWANALAGLYRDANPSKDPIDISLEIGINGAKVLALGIADSSNLDDYLPHDEDGEELSSPTRFWANHKHDTRKNDSFLSSKQYDSVARFVADKKLLHRYHAVMVYAFDDWTDPASLAQYAIRHYVTGYGYDSSTVPVRLSLTVLFIYILIVTVYVAYSLFTGRTATSWDSIGEVVMLALNSRQPEHIKGCSVGVETLSTYRKPVNIRIQKKKNEAELIFEDDPGLQNTEYKVVELNERY